ncbi:MAG: pyridoxamine 5'-phosphate oxidase family protein [Candidatus Omnitrophota bacterium]|jgi:predicted pyridoxine 5'-phosphate oxidase superfamily flavin-nucleotide-binding protein
MKRLSESIIRFFHKQGCVIVSTVDRNGFPHSSCKGIIDITSNGRVYLLDLYHGFTYENLRRDPGMAITAIDEHKFTGYCLKGKALITPEGELKPDIIKAWEARITSRLTQRLLKNIREERGHPRHPEILLPKPKYMITMEVEDIVDLTPRHLK